MKKVHSSNDRKNHFSRLVGMLTAASLAVDSSAARRLHSSYKAHVVGKRPRALCSAGLVASLVVMVLISPAWAAAPSSSASGASGYEIPLGELKKVKKERPVKKERKERTKKKVVGAVQPSAEQVAPTEKDVQIPVTGVPGRDGLPGSRQQPVPEKISSDILHKTEILQTSTSPVTIHHDPYSYVITGKRSTIQAVISSANSIQAVYCRFRATENGAYAVVPMVQAPGTQFTYVATLPSLGAVSRALRYTIIAIDSMGNESRSQEFIIAVKSSAVLPGWQLENSLDMIRIKRENKDKPLEGFADSGIVIE